MKKSGKEMKVILKFISFTFLFCILGFQIYSQKNNDLDIVLTAEKPEFAFKAGDKIEIEVTLANKTTNDIYFLQDNVIDDFFIEVKDGRGNTTPKRKEEKIRNLLPKTGSRYLVQLKPNEEYKFLIDISSIYNLQKGIYILKVSRSISQEDKKTVVNIKSKPINIQIK